MRTLITTLPNHLPEDKESLELLSAFDKTFWLAGAKTTNCPLGKEIMEGNEFESGLRGNGE
jgi:hypothetical protein